MDLIREYWWLLAVIVVLALAFVLLRPKQRVKLTDSAPVRPHMTQQKAPPEGRGLTGKRPPRPATLRDIFSGASPPPARCEKDPATTCAA